MDEDVGVATDRGGEVRVERQVERVVVVLGDVEHARAEVLGAVHRLRGGARVSEKSRKPRLESGTHLGREVLESQARTLVGDVVDRAHERARAAAVEVHLEALHAVNEGLLRRNIKSQLRFWST